MTFAQHTGGKERKGMAEEEASKKSTSLFGSQCCLPIIYIL